MRWCKIVTIDLVVTPVTNYTMINVSNALDVLLVTIVLQALVVTPRYRVMRHKREQDGAVGVTATTHHLGPTSQSRANKTTTGDGKYENLGPTNDSGPNYVGPNYWDPIVPAAVPLDKLYQL